MLDVIGLVVLERRARVHLYTIYHSVRAQVQERPIKDARYPLEPSRLAYAAAGKAAHSHSHSVKTLVAISRRRMAGREVPSGRWRP